MHALECLGKPPGTENPLACSLLTFRYVLAYVFDRPADNRRSLKELTQALDAVDATFTDAARRGQGPAAVAAASAARGTAKKEGAQGGVKGAALAQQRQQQQRGAGKSSANPRSAVPHFLSALQSHMRTHKVTVGGWVGALAPTAQDHSRGGGLGHHRTVPSSTPRPLTLRDVLLLTNLFTFHTLKVSLKELLRRCDTNGDGRLDAPDLRKLVRTVLPAVSEAQMAYIRGALNPLALMQVRTMCGEGGPHVRVRI